MRNVGSSEMCFSGEIDGSYSRRERAMVKEKGERERGAHREMHKENISPKILAKKMKGPDFHEFL